MMIGSKFVCQNKSTVNSWERWPHINDSSVLKHFGVLFKLNLVSNEFIRRATEVFFRDSVHLFTSWFNPVSQSPSISFIKAHQFALVSFLKINIYFTIKLKPRFGFFSFNFSLFICIFFLFVVFVTLCDSH